MPAKAKNIRDALSKKNHSVGIVLDGVAGKTLYGFHFAATV